MLAWPANYKVALAQFRSDLDGPTSVSTAHNAHQRSSPATFAGYPWVRFSSRATDVSARDGGCSQLGAHATERFPPRSSQNSGCSCLITFACKSGLEGSIEDGSASPQLRSGGEIRGQSRESVPEARPSPPLIVSWLGGPTDMDPKR
jgi:hypothetical protein